MNWNGLNEWIGRANVLYHGGKRDEAFREYSKLLAEVMVYGQETEQRAEAAEDALCTLKSKRVAIDAAIACLRETLETTTELDDNETQSCTLPPRRWRAPQGQYISSHPVLRHE